MISNNIKSFVFFFVVASFLLSSAVLAADNDAIVSSTAAVATNLRNGASGGGDDDGQYHRLLCISGCMNELNSGDYCRGISYCSNCCNACPAGNTYWFLQGWFCD